MLFIKYLNRWGLLTLSLTLSQISGVSASVVTGKCGEYIFQVKILNGTDMGERQFKLYYKKKKQKIKLFYKTGRGENLEAACIQNKRKQDLMLFLESYGGNAGPEDNYGIFDPSSKKMLIKPSDWPKGNAKQAQQIIGEPPPFFDEGEKKIFFCCSADDYGYGETSETNLSKNTINNDSEIRAALRDKEAVEMAVLLDDPDKKIERARRMLKEGYAPGAVAKMTDLMLLQVMMLQQEN